MPLILVETNRKALRTFYTVRHNITGPTSFKRHNLVNIWLIYIQISDNITEGMLSLKQKFKETSVEVLLDRSTPYHTTRGR